MNILVPTFYALIAGSATLLGLALTLFAAKFVKRYSFAIVSLAAGVMLGTGFLHILPEAALLTGQSAYIYLLVGFAGFYVIESLVGAHCCSSQHKDDHHAGKEHKHVLGSVAALGIFFHSILDGVAIAIGFEVSTTLGIVTALAVIIHELPEGVFTFSILLHSGMKRSRAVLWTAIVSLATPAGALATLLLFPDLSAEALGIMLAIAAGSFIYIAAADLVPESHHSRSITTGAFVILGIIIMLMINTTLGHDHAHPHDDLSHDTEEHDHYHSHELEGDPGLHEEDHDHAEEHDHSEDEHLN
jgi:zinc and cadmium transporter